jgi:glycosyltransferase involved in cell wall biosynthesis
MRIVVNAINLKSAGGLNVVLNYLAVNKRQPTDVRFIVLAPFRRLYQDYECDTIEIRVVPKVLLSPFTRIIADHLVLSGIIRDIDPDVVFTMGNMAVPCSVPQAVLFMYPYAIYPKERDVWKRMDWKKYLSSLVKVKIFGSRLKYAQVVFPQTNVSEERLKKYYPGICELKVIPTAFSALTTGSRAHPTFNFTREKGVTYLLCLTRYYSHKNLEIFIPLAKLFKSADAKYKIITTIEEDQGKGAKEYIDSIAQNDLNDYILNIGRIEQAEVPLLYDRVDALLLPTLLESFSGTYADCLRMRKPILTSNRDFAVDVCGEAAWYFDPLDADNIYSQICSAFADIDGMKRKVEIGYALSNNMLTWDEVAPQFTSELYKLNEQNIAIIK